MDNVKFKKENRKAEIVEETHYIVKMYVGDELVEERFLKKSLRRERVTVRSQPLKVPRFRLYSKRSRLLCTLRTVSWTISWASASDKPARRATL